MTSVRRPSSVSGVLRPLRAQASRGRHATAEGGPGQADAPAGRSAGRSLARRLIAAARATAVICGRNRMAVAGALTVAAVAAFCFIGPLLYHTDQQHVNLALANLSPRAGHPLGTDGDGVDQLGRLMAGGQVSLVVGISAGLLATVLGTAWGAVAGYLGGIADAVMMRLVDAALAIPALFLLLMITAIFRPSTWALILVIAGTSWLGTSRLVRGSALTLRTREYVQAVRVMRGGGVRVVVRHIMPNTLGTIMVNVTFQIADAIVLLATLGYLGLGVQPPSVDWGSMIGAGILYIHDGDWWLIYPPGLAIALVVIAFNFIGDGLRDSLGVRWQRH